MWVKLVVYKQLDQEGKRRGYSPGDWVDVGKQTALQWLRSGEAVLPSQASRQGLGALVDLRDCQVVVTGGRDLQRDVLNLYPDLAVVSGPDVAPTGKTLYYDTTLGDVRLDLWASAFGWLDRFDVVCPLLSYDKLAADLGTAKERALTKDVVRELRVPVYEPALLWLRHNATTVKLTVAYDHELKRGEGNRHLSFLRALYQTAPLVVAAPPTWLDAKSIRRGVRA